MLETLLVISIALLIDHLLGEPKRFHPLVGFGWFASRYEQVFNQPESHNPFLSGLLGVILLCTIPALLLTLTYATPIAWLFEAIILYLAIGACSLKQHAMNVYQALQDGDLEKSKERVGRMVSRNTEQMDEQQISRAAIESTLENGNDAIFGALFWFIVAGIPGVVLYRLVNTLDAMWGYRTARFEQFGKAAARLDDVLNYLPARLTALSYGLCGNLGQALRCWQKQAHQLASPNGGPVMCAGAGALECQLGGAVYYHGQLTERAIFGCGTTPDKQQIQHAVQLVQRSIWLWFGTLSLLTFAGIITNA